jgi:hypothetical protein
MSLKSFVLTKLTDLYRRGFFGPVYILKLENGDEVRLYQDGTFSGRFKGNIRSQVIIDDWEAMEVRGDHEYDLVHDYEHDNESD